MREITTGSNPTSRCEHDSANVCRICRENALEDERHRLIERLFELKTGERPCIQTFAGHFEVDGVNRQFEALTHPAGEELTEQNMRTWQMSNDNVWAGLLERAGVARHPLFSEEAS